MNNATLVAAVDRQTAVEETADSVTRRTEYEYDANGQQSLVRDPLGHETRFEYDEFGRRTATVYDDDSRTETAYDDFGNVTAETDALGAVRTFEYDAQGRLTAVVLPEVYDPVTETTVAPRYEYEYDPFGNRMMIRDPLGHETHFTYDGQGRQLSRTLPSGQTETFQYDERGRQTRHTDFEGTIIDSVFSDPGFLDQLWYFPAGSDPEVDTPEETVDYDYDVQGRRVSTTDDRGETEYAYDLDGRATQIDSPEGTINYEYDPVTGQRTRTFGRQWQQTRSTISATAMTDSGG